MNISFYELNNSDENELFKIICDLCFKFYNLNRNVYILCPDTPNCHKLDEYIINYQINNFFPYQIYGDGPIPPAPICLGTDAATKLKYDILINLHSIIPDNFVKYKQIIEFVAAKPDMRAIARLHYKHYKKLGKTVEFNTVGKLEIL